MGDRYNSCIHDPTGAVMAVAVRHIFLYRGRHFITWSRLVSRTSGLWKVQDGHLCVFELLKNVHRVAIVHNCDERCTVRRSRLQHSACVYRVDSITSLSALMGISLMSFEHHGQSTVVDKMHTLNETMTRPVWERSFNTVDDIELVGASRLVSRSNGLWKVQDENLCVASLLEYGHCGAGDNCDERCILRGSRHPCLLSAAIVILQHYRIR